MPVPLPKRMFILLVVALVLAGCASPSAQTRDITLFGSAIASGAPFRAAHPVVVPAQTSGINATLAWNGSSAALGMEIYAPNGSRAASAAPSSAGPLGIAVFDAPVPGTWALYVYGDVAATTGYELRIRLPEKEPVTNTMSRIADVRPGSFVELNFLMAKGATMRYTLDATKPVRWDVHSHPGSDVKTWDQGANATHAGGTFTATEETVYSVLAMPQGETSRVRIDVVGRIEPYG
jgi:hypothetical protein